MRKANRFSIALSIALLLVIPVAAICASKELIAAFDAVKRVSFIAGPGDGNEARQLDAEKALDAAKREIASEEDKRLYALLKASLQSSVMARADRSDLELAIQCRLESMLAFSPDELNKAAMERAKKGTCIADYRQRLHLDDPKR